MINKNFYPTPKHLIERMWAMIDKKRVGTILEPSAGKGDILDFIKERSEGCYGRRYKLAAIEIDTELQAALKGKEYRLIDSDYLAYCGLDRFDLIIGNPPFDHGDFHLMKAISMMDNGQIVFLLNAETIKNPFSNTRKQLVEKLQELNATIEFIPNAFLDAERKTAVEIALVYISIERDITESLFEGCEKKESVGDLSFDDSAKDLASRNTVEYAVEKFNAKVKAGTELILHFYKAQRLVGGALELRTKQHEGYSQETINELFNQFLQITRKDSWKKILDIPEIKKRMTSDSLKEFHSELEKQAEMDFTERNIRTFISNLFGSYDKILTKAVGKIFDVFTKDYHWHEECAKNVHYFNGWKTNKAFYVNKKVIVPYRQWLGYYSADALRYGKVDADIERALDDIDMVMNYFTIEQDFVSIASSINHSLAEKKYCFGVLVESSHFLIRVYKKGTIHLTFKDEGTLRRFNITACKEKNWLPEDYGRKKYADMNAEEKKTVSSFEGEKTYMQNIGKIGFTKETLMIEGESA